MEIILETIRILCPLIATGMNIYFFLKIQEVHKVLLQVNSLVEMESEYLSMMNDRLNSRLFSISENIDRSTLSLKKILEPTEPIKPKNNWDSIREAFKGPTRIENERD
jgi:hypothetical protein